MYDVAWLRQSVAVVSLKAVAVNDGAAIIVKTTTNARSAIVKK